MSKTKLFLDVVTDLRALADSLHALADALASRESAGTNEPESVSLPPVTLEKVRAVLAEKSQDGFGTEVRALLEKHGAKKLSEIDPFNFSTMLMEAEALGRG